MQPTDIEWCDFSSNPLKLKLRESGKLVNACVLKSAGCINCYSQGIVRRFWRKEWGKFPGYTKALMKLGEWTLDEKEIRRMLTFKPKPPFKNGSDRACVFPFDMTDVFGEWVPFELIDRLFAVFALRPDVNWLLLTKRPERAAEYLNETWQPGTVDGQKCGPLNREDVVKDLAIDDLLKGKTGEPRWWTPEGEAISSIAPWPLPNVWLGTSCEDQQRADERIPHLLRCPAAVRFLSVEPLIGPVGLRSGIYSDITNPNGPPRGTTLEGIDWIIVGAESGAGRRPMKTEWAQSIAAQCKAAGVAMFMKQMEVGKKISGDIETFPEDLRIRELPRVEKLAATV